MNDKVKQMIREWVTFNHNDTEKTAKWMRDKLHIGGIKICREHIAAALKD